MSEIRCSNCGESEAGADCVEAHPYQQLGEQFVQANGDLGGYEVVEEGEDLEMRCRKCGGIFWIRYSRQAQAAGGVGAYVL